MARRLWGLLAGGLLFVALLVPTAHVLHSARSSWQGDQGMVIASPWNGDAKIGRFMPFPRVMGEFIHPD